MEAARTLRSWLDDRADEMAQLVCDLVAIPSENPPGRERERSVDALVAALDRLGLEPRVLDAAGVVQGGLGDGPRTVYLHGHYDVVPAQDPGQFTPRRSGGGIVGRGAADMKGGLVSMLYAAAALREAGLPLDGRLAFNLVPDEETGSELGSGYLLREGLIDPGAVAMLTAEPTGGAIWNASRGAVSVNVRVGGREAHAGLAHEGVNAFEAMLDVAGALRDLARELAPRGTHLVLGGVASGGASFNVVPGSASFSADRRFNADERLEDERERLLETIRAAAERSGADVSVEVLQEAPAAATDERGPAAAALARAVREVEGREPRFEVCPGVLEIRWYARLGIPAFAYGPGGLDVSHGPDEYLDEAAMRRCALVYALVAADLLGPE